MHFFVAKLLSIAAMTYVQLRLITLGAMITANLLRAQRIHLSMQRHHVRMTRDPTVV